MTEPGKEMSTSTRCRKPHTRSRGGCLTCRKRRVRCDGGQPICSDLPLRDRRAEWLPGEHQPWTVDTQVALNPGSPMTNSMDPFDCLGLDMSFKSRQLLHYFRYAKGCTDMLSNTAGKDPFSLLSIHPDALRDTLLVAGLHYAWTVGDIHTYQSTLLFHKVATIRILNKWLHNINQPGLMTFVRHVSILCFVEGCHGNVAAAETHLKGLVNAVDLLSPSDSNFPNTLSVGEELANRYLIFTHYSFQGFKARIVSSAALQKIFTQENVAEFSDFLSLVYDWREQRIGNLDKRLGAMRMMPFFFAVLPPEAKFYDIDASSMVECLKSLTATILFTSDDHITYDPSWEWIEGSESRLLYETVKAHFASLSEPQDDGNVHDDDSSETPRLSTSWSSMCVATSLYLHSALGIWYAGESLEPCMFRRFLSILMRDVDRNVHQIRSPSLSHLWFWKTFLGAYSIAKLQSCGSQKDVGEFEKCFDRLISTWSRVCGVDKWKDAKARLVNITWPLGHSLDLAEKVWKKATQ
ncbi:uncharacterized protein NECHADRAFT_87630 [Fusarium vanettenii 77-13-4]|uniref:Zn(2)-C6 fungal-type domain-containing protein n=1 Tax=Fusarium vanettenii (strain ATCC MYA-4622 / CBS 123669 / FGSC 9596 / NRRL 45880 / 77-13-4) TaxID=660122 RepID=C7Z2K3_FUSV7|nr:uncharacterized protein NECHADRAFT_87630 [Fusarium vanettenii 77-13-4]EEU41680.1 hypothetical protein NECHADRAFT_87630 [Fusarium vanettenii 77-13-4]